MQRSQGSDSVTQRFSHALLALAQARPPVRYGLALAVIALALGIALALERALGPGVPPYLTFYPAVIVVAVLAGWWPGVVAMTGAVLTANYFLMEPIGKLGFATPIEWLRSAVFVAVCLLTSWVAELYLRARDRVAAYDRDATLTASARALGETEERLRVVVEAANLGTWDFDPATGASVRSPRHDELFGYREAQSEWPAGADERHIVPEDLPLLRAARLRARETGVMAVEMRVRRPDGSVHWISVDGRAVDRNGAQHLVGVVSDISARKSAEERLRRSEALYRGIGESIDYGVWVADANGRNTYASESLLQVLGMTQQQFSDYGWGDAMHPDEAAVTIAAWQACVQSGSNWSRVLRFRGGDGEWRHVLGRGVPIRDESGRLVCWAGINLDVADLHRAEEAARAAMAEAERANSAKSRFLAASSHDLRQPLAALSMYTGLLRRQVGAPEQKVVANMTQCIASLNALLNDLLDFSKLEAGVVTAKLSDFPLAETLASLEAAHAPEAAVRGLSFRCRPSPWMVRCDPVLLRRILGNLIENAIRYTRYGGVLVSCRRRHGKAWVEVWDSGIGIPADKREEIFEEFRQLGDQARTTGSGLGLAIVAKTSVLLGLEVNVRSRPGRGSVFAIELNVLPAQQAGAIEAEALPRAAARRPLRIALCEDVAVVRTAFELGLQSLGHEVVSARSKDELIVRLGQLAPRLVIADHRLGHGETGFSVIAAVRAHASGADGVKGNSGNSGHSVDALHMPAILMTGDTDPAVIRSMADRGVVVLHKPVDLEMLQRCIDGLTEGTAQRRAARPPAEVRVPVAGS